MDAVKMEGWGTGLSLGHSWWYECCLWAAVAGSRGQYAHNHGGGWEISVCAVLVVRVLPLGSCCRPE